MAVGSANTAIAGFADARLGTTLRLPGCVERKPEKDLKMMERMRRGSMPGRMVLLLLSACAAGCTTIKAVEQTGKEFSRGNVVAGLWNGTMGVAVAGIVDVFTLGGVADADTTVGIANALQSGRGASSSAWGGEGPRAVSGQGLASRGAAAQPRAYKAANDCVRYEARTEQLDKFVNGCGFDVGVFYADGDAKVYYGLIAAPMKAIQVHNANGSRAWAACEHPGRAVTSAGVDWRSGAFVCRE